MTNKRLDSAVTEMVGISLLLGMAILLFSILNIVVFSYPLHVTPPSVHITGSVDRGVNRVILEHNGGSNLDLDTRVVLMIDDSPYEIKIGENDYLSPEFRADGVWNIGEKVVYTHPVSLIGKSVEVMVLDPDGDGVLMLGVFE